MSYHIKHHLTDDLLMGYSAGALPEAFNLVIATHISLCDECRARLGSFDALGGAVVDTVAPAPMSPGALSATLAMIAAHDNEIPPQTAPQTSSIFPAPLQAYVAGDLDDVAWRKVGGGVSQMLLNTSKDATVRLLKIPAGVAVPDHGHHGTELTLVLQGAFVDEHDRFAQGDIEIATKDTHHTPVAEEGMDCICLAATDAPLQFTGIIPRIAQRFTGI
jgi:putative transcriptional regulator